jgi:hypothetical protein
MIKKKEKQSQSSKREWINWGILIQSNIHSNDWIIIAQETMWSNPSIIHNTERKDKSQ